MPPFYDGYQQAGYGQYPQYEYGHAQLSQQNAAFANQQQQAQPSVPSQSPQLQQQDLQAQMQWQNYAQPNFNYNQQFIPPPQHQNFHVPHPQTPTYQQSSPLQQFAAGQLQDPRQQQQQYWQQPRHDQNYLNSYQIPQSQPQAQPQRVQTNSQTYHPTSQQDLRQAVASSPIPGHHANGSQMGYAPVNGPRLSQQVPYQSHAQHPQSTPDIQRQQSVPSRPSQATPVSDQRHRQQHQQYQQTPSQPSQFSSQQPSRSSLSTNGPIQQTPTQHPIQTPQRTSQAAQTPSSTSNSRTLTHVQIPAYRPDEMAKGVTPQGRTAKRRRSNEGETIHVNQPQKQQPPPPPQAFVQIPKPPESSPLTELHTSQVVPPTPSPDVDYQSVLLSLSDEYVTAAHQMSARLCSAGATEEDWEQYHKLIATALGCLESITLNYRPTDARKEARVRLRFAILLFEETEDTVTTEESLNKGISFCERNRLTDVKYAMRHLLIRVIHKTNPKAAMRALEKLIEEVETMGFVLWIYALRFLRVSLSMQSGGPQDISVTLRHLTALNDHADAHDHVGIRIITALLEAMVHLRSGDRMAVEQASRSLTTARTHQLESVMTEIPQLRATMDLLDLGCTFLQPVSPDQFSQRVNQFHQWLDETARVSGWTADGSFLLHISPPSNSDIEEDTGGIFRRSSNGGVALAFMWLSRSQLYMTGYMLSGVALMSKNPEDRRAEKTLVEGLKLNISASNPPAMSIKLAETTNDLQQRTAISIKLLQIFASCGRADWTAALPAIESLRAELARSPQYQDQYTICSLLFLHGACKQGLGEEATALEIYRSPELSIQLNLYKTVTAIKDLQVLAALSSISIMRFMQMDQSIPETLLRDLGPYCESHPNKSIIATYHLLQAHEPGPGSTIIKMKQCLQAALKPVQFVKNIRVMAVIMNTMTSSFFDGVVGKQAINGVYAGKQLSSRSHDPLWNVIGEGMYRDVLHRVGDVAGAMKANQSFENALAKVPAGVQNKMLQGHGLR